MNSRFALEIYQPGDSEDVLRYFESDHPFLAIHQGDFVSLPDYEKSPMEVLVVVSVEHAVWEAASVVKHKLIVYTKSIPNTPESRHNG